MNDGKFTEDAARRIVGSTRRSEGAGRIGFGQRVPSPPPPVDDFYVGRIDSSTPGTGPTGRFAYTVTIVGQAGVKWDGWQPVTGSETVTAYNGFEVEGGATAIDNGSLVLMRRILNSNGVDEFWFFAGGGGDSIPLPTAPGQYFQSTAGSSATGFIGYWDQARFGGSS